MTSADWKSLTLGEFVRLQRGHDLTEAERRQGTVPVFGSAGPNGYHDEPLAPGPGVVIGRSGDSMGVVSYARTDFWPHNTVLYVTDFLGNCPRFAYYFLKRLQLRRFDSGSAQASLNRNFIYPIPIQIPRRDEQERIAALLGALDDKIELNRRMNETLEAMARAIFQDWFVTFGPTRAKMEGRPPYLAPDLWSLFPNRLDAEGKPDGWVGADVYRFAEVIYGAPFASSRFNADRRGLPLIRIRDLSDHNPSIFTDEEHPKGQTIEPGDIVVGMDGEFRLHQWKGPRALLNQRVCHFRPKLGVPRTFVAHALTAPLAFFERGKVGTTVIHLGKSDIDTIRLLDPGQRTLDGFGSIVEPLLARVIANSAESRTLAATRDLLLPRLMSGEIRVKDAERVVETAA